ncbi:TIGR00645 family protein [Caenispirillum bisanense]|uniref:TIGR00645 family protein n=1 Tax=Caenispirillum bisanense TaxID=414052 RepID=UPI0031E33679
MEHFIENNLFRSRWLLFPFYVGLALGIVALLAKFLQELWHLLPHIFSMTEAQVILLVLTLVDITLLANLMLMVIFVSYENFVSRFMCDHADRPGWMDTMDFSSLKLKLLGSIAAISAIQLLKVFMDENGPDPNKVPWLIGIHLTIAVSGMVLALMDKWSHGAHEAPAAPGNGNGTGNGGSGHH